MKSWLGGQPAKNDTLEHVASYIGQYADDYFQMTGITCGLDIPAQLPPHPLSSQMRHHLFLAVHEAFTNILKHSGATRAGVSMTCGAAALEITVTDDGGGFDPATIAAGPEEAAGSGNGLPQHAPAPSRKWAASAESNPNGAAGDHHPVRPAPERPVARKITP